MTMNSDDQAYRKEAKKISGIETAGLIGIVLTNYVLCISYLVSLPLSVGYRTTCAFIALTFGYGVSGKFMWRIIHKLTGLPSHRCIYYGTFVGHALGAVVGAAAGEYFAG